MTTSEAPLAGVRVDRRVMPHCSPVLVSYGAGTNSTAMLVEMVKRGEMVDAITRRTTGLATLELRIRGAGWPCELGQTIPRTTATVTLRRDDDGRELARVVDWGLPDSHERHNVEFRGAKPSPATQG